MTGEYKICIETFIRWEQLTGRSFRAINLENEEDLCSLLYCAYCVGVGCTSSYEVFSKTMKSNSKLYRRAIKAFTHHNTLTQQFSALTPAMQKSSDNDTNSVQQLSFIGDIAARLVIAGGVDVHYVMRDMTVNDMLLFVKALDDRQRQESEAQRLWTYLSMLPHVDGKKLNTPQKLITFPWEIEERKQEIKRVKEEMYAEFESFMRGGNPASLETKEQDNGK